MEVVSARDREKIWNSISAPRSPGETIPWPKLGKGVRTFFSNIRDPQGSFMPSRLAVSFGDK